MSNPPSEAGYQNRRGSRRRKTKKMDAARANRLRRWRRPEDLGDAMHVVRQSLIAPGADPTLLQVNAWARAPRALRRASVNASLTLAG